MSDEEANKIRAENEEVRKEREVSAEVLATKYSSFKRDFLSAPIRKAMKMCLEKKGN